MARDFHPCLSCGACCAYFRVLFYWREAERENAARWVVPLALTEEHSDFERRMKGTGENHGRRCVALRGKVGQAGVGCTIYGSRPSPCRAFEASYETGVKNLRCDEARAAYGLNPLRRADWPCAPFSPQPSAATTLPAGETIPSGL